MIETPRLLTIPFHLASIFGNRLIPTGCREGYVRTGSEVRPDNSLLSTSFERFHTNNGYSVETYNQIGYSAAIVRLRDLGIVNNDGKTFTDNVSNYFFLYQMEWVGKWSCPRRLPSDRHGVLSDQKFALHGGRVFIQECGTFNDKHTTHYGYFPTGRYSGANGERVNTAVIIGPRNHVKPEREVTVGGTWFTDFLFPDAALRIKRKEKAPK